MSKREAIARYNLIISKLRRQPATFGEIADHLAMESEIQGYDFNISKRTFQRDRKDIAAIYNIDIEYDFRRQVYYIEMDESSGVSAKIFEAFDTLNALNIADRVSEHIHFEKRRPQGTENLYGLLHAIKNRYQVRFIYEKFTGEKATLRTLEPYALKEFRNRWYVLGKDTKDNRIKAFGLDRLSSLDITQVRFTRPKDFDVNEFYRYCFGVISPDDQQPEIVELSFNPFQGEYIKSLPLHHSQEIIKDDEKELRIKLKLYVTHDFYMELLSLGNNVKVIQPEHLTEQMKETYREALGRYGK
ncbi:MAG: WYL domain-containing protein [Bacteroidales bacterium]|nr:WYL domain-containing protein [Bacteroidales bacterium]MCF8338385.1 WYL domain-containing protein [Bacteroidales bacterium]